MPWEPRDEEFSFAELEDLADQYRLTGDPQIAGELYARAYPSALATARAIVAETGTRAGTWDAEDLAAEGFTRTLEALRNGVGPTDNFSGYLNTAIRNLNADRWRRRESRTMLTDDVERSMLESGQDVGSEDTAIETMPERDLVERALAVLHPQWRKVLWAIDVEGNRPADYARSAGASPAATHQLLYRARQGLRESYLRELVGVVDEQCALQVDALVSHELGTLSSESTRSLDIHLESCTHCQRSVSRIRRTTHEPAALAIVLAGLTGTAVAGGAGVAGVGSGIAAATSEVPGGVVKSVAFRWLAGAAAGAIVIAGAWFMLRSPEEAAPEQAAPRTTEQPGAIPTLENEMEAGSIETPEPVTETETTPTSPTTRTTVTGTTRPPHESRDRVGEFALLSTENSASTGVVDLVLAAKRTSPMEVTVTVEDGGKILSTSLPGCVGSFTSMTCVVPTGFANQAKVKLSADPVVTPGGGAGAGPPATTPLAKTRALKLTTRATMVGTDGVERSGRIGGMVTLPVK